MDVWISPVKDIVVALAAIIGSGVALIGLSTWRRQLEGTAEYELARRLLKEVYQFREALQSVRFPFIAVKEMELSDDEGPAPVNDKDRRHRELAKAYQNRYDRVYDARNALEATLLEVEVLWGAELVEKVRKLYSWDAELYAAIMEHLDTVISDAPNGGRNLADRQRTREIINSRGNRKEDKFLSGLQGDIQEIERNLKPHLKRRV
ncbi:hypothetical protein QPM17_18570 [Marinobacter sp. TBZ242]|uniref:DUF4760 domain-containing protein n=1 Tax=Marinobacter azerbaijanicus TaxID=3050455 RepID=A0ABT7IG53_9GAMM|nr:hypothetical protein [Marinobacter sp. TBZ242]MDL0433149.1 hypothetical protein [Marinobacter sp. TBZ242]